ncbi:MAG: glycosyltransferase family 2 protein [Thermoleophilia bacterium]
MRTVGIVTPWIDHPELLPDYAQAVARADEVVIVNNGAPDSDGGFFDAGFTVTRAGGTEGWSSMGFAESNNHGAEFVKTDIVVFLNNDILGDPSWIDQVRADVEDGALYGPSIGTQTLRGLPVPYVEGWCVAATRSTWEHVGPWDAERFPKPYWEDVELSLRAVRRGVRLMRAPWAIAHLGGRSTSTTPGAWDGFDAQRRIVEQDLLDIMEAAKP